MANPPAARPSGSEPAALSLAGVSMAFAPDAPKSPEAVSPGVLADVSLNVAAGEFVSLVGPSGCGKSTLLRIAAGLVEPTSGTVEVNRDRLGFVFQDPTLLAWRTVRENVELFAELHSVPKGTRAELAQAAIETVGLAGYEDHHPNALSGGMKMRASLARSLTLDPDVFLFDEPFAAVDEMTRERLNDEVLALFAARGFAGLFVTHSVAEAVFMASRVLVMSDRPGTIIEAVPVDFAYPRPAELRFDAAFAAKCGQVAHALRNKSDPPKSD